MMLRIPDHDLQCQSEERGNLSGYDENWNNRPFLYEFVRIELMREETDSHPLTEEGLFFLWANISIPFIQFNGSSWVRQDGFCAAGTEHVPYKKCHTDSVRDHHPSCRFTA